jgi:hypothetical protein
MRHFTALSAGLIASVFAFAGAGAAAAPGLSLIPVAPTPQLQRVAQQCTCIRYVHVNPKVRRCAEQRCVTIPDPPRCQRVCVQATGIKAKRCVRWEQRCS